MNMNDVSHELGSLRHIVDSPLSSKVAMFNKVANQHQSSQLLNPFANPDGRASPKPQFSKDEYGKPLAGSLTELRGQKANIHVCKEMQELCDVIHSEGVPAKDDPNIRVILFGDLFNIYNFISDKCVGLLLRARKHKLVEFEGEMLFQRRDDDVPIFLCKPIEEIKEILEAKQADFKRGMSPAPQATSLLLNESARRSQSPNIAKKPSAPSPLAKVQSAPTSPIPKIIASKVIIDTSKSKILTPIPIKLLAPAITVIQAPSNSATILVDLTMSSPLLPQSISQESKAEVVVPNSNKPPTGIPESPVEPLAKIELNPANSKSAIEVNEEKPVQKTEPTILPPTQESITTENQVNNGIQHVQDALIDDPMVTALAKIKLIIIEPSDVDVPTDIEVGLEHAEEKLSVQAIVNEILTAAEEIVNSQKNT